MILYSLLHDIYMTQMKETCNNLVTMDCAVFTIVVNPQQHFWFRHLNRCSGKVKQITKSQDSQCSKLNRLLDLRFIIKYLYVHCSYKPICEEGTYVYNFLIVRQE